MLTRIYGPTNLIAEVDVDRGELDRWSSCKRASYEVGGVYYVIPFTAIRLITQEVSA